MALAVLHMPTAVPELNRQQEPWDNVLRSSFDIRRGACDRIASARVGARVFPLACCSLRVD